MSTRILAALLFSPLLFSCGGDDPLMPPAVPDNLVAEADPNSKQITLNWNAVSNATSYTIFWNTEHTQSKYSNAVATDNMTEGITTNSYVHTGLADNETYYYRVAASNQAGSRGLSSEASASLTP